MRRTLILVLAGFLLCSRSTAAFDEGIQPSNAEIANAIRLYYESRLGELQPEFRGHWVLRLYRTSGDSRYLGDLRAYGAHLMDEFEQFVSGLNDPTLKALKVSELLGPVQRSKKGKYGKRRQVLAEVTDYLYMHQLLYLTFMTQSVGLDQQQVSTFKTALAALKGFSFRPYLGKTELILYYAAEVSNDVYYLKHLGLDDFEDDFFKIFRSVYSAPDEGLDKVMFENKIYGLTHLIIAASEYYQRSVSRKKFKWVLDYFDRNADRILTRLKPDVAAEVGICFLLAGLTDHPVVAKTRKFVARSWDPASGMIPSVHGNTDLNNGEHRNVLAIMLLQGFTQLYPGPDLRVESV